MNGFVRSSNELVRRTHTATLFLESSRDYSQGYYDSRSLTNKDSEIQVRVAILETCIYDTVIAVYLVPV